MIEFDVGGHRYKAGNLPALQQVYIIRRIGPIITTVIEAIARLPKPTDGGNVVPLRPGGPTDSFGQMLEAIEPVMGAFAKLSDEDAKFVIDTCLGLVQRQQETGAWARIWEARSGQSMFGDIEGPQMLAITIHVLQDTFNRFSAAVPQLSPTVAQPGQTS